MNVAARAGGGFRAAPFALLGDERLVGMAAAGHPRAFAVVYERHHQALYRYCRSILRNDADAQDALQSTFAAAFAALGRGRPDAPIRPWLFRIAHNEAVSTLRRRRPTSDLSAASDWCTTSVEDQVAERAELDTLLHDLRELGERQRSALVMRELSGLSHEEIALALDTSVGAAKQTIYEARRSLFEFAEGRAMPCDEIRRTISDADGRLLRSRRVRAHLRECSGCAAFAAAIPERSGELRALVPTLPTVLAAGMLERVAGAAHGTGTGTGLAGLATGATGKAAGTALAANALAGVAVVASATVAVTIGVDKLVQASHPAAARHTATPAVRSLAPRSRTPASALPLSATHPLIRPRPHDASQAVSSTFARRGVTAKAMSHRTATPSRGVSGGRAPASAPGRFSAAPGRSASAPGQAGSAAPGHSGSAPGRSTSSAAGGRNSASTPGHASTTSTAPGRSAVAPGHAGTTSPASGHSGSAPGHATGSGGSTTVSTGAATTPADPAMLTTPQSPPITAPGAAVSASHKH